MKVYSQYDPSRDFTTLAAWQKARDLKLFIYREVIPLLPDAEKYNLNIQLRKTGVSGTANIAEGYGRHYYKDAIRFYRYARGSIYESKDHITSCYDLKYISQFLFEKGLKLVEEAKVALNGYMTFVRNQNNATDDDEF